MDIEKVLRDRRIISSDPDIMNGTPVFVGTRVPLQTFFDYLEGESGLTEFLEDMGWRGAKDKELLTLADRHS